MTCPMYKRADGTEAEDRGTSHWIWNAPGFHRCRARFESFTQATERVEVSVPIGWSLAPGSFMGVALVNVLGERIGPLIALEWAEDGEMGFRVRKREEFDR